MLWAGRALQGYLSTDRQDFTSIREQPSWPDRSCGSITLLPLPNTIGTYDAVNTRYTGNWASQQNLTGYTNKIVGRLDEQLTANDRLSINLYPFTITCR